MTAYLDNSATTRPGASVQALIRELAESGWYNPSALYKPSLEIQKRMDHVRETCLRAAGAEECRIVFTSGGTESDNLALLGHMKTRRTPGNVLISSVEHPAVSACAEELRRMGHSVSEIPARRDGTVDLQRLEEMMGPETAMISLMQVNNETGATEPLEAVAELRNRICPEAAIHVDGVQGFLRVPISFRRLGIQSYAFSAHKIHGLKGTGALIVAGKHPLKPLIFGGGQEGNLRSGTENTFGILALGTAVQEWRDEDCARLRQLKLRLWNALKERIPDAQVNGPAPEEGAPLFFDAEEGGICCGACQSCRDQTPLTPGQIRWMRRALASGSANWINTPDAQAPFSLLKDYVERRLGRRLKSGAMLPKE